MDPSQAGWRVPPGGVVTNSVHPPSIAWACRASVYTTLAPMILFVILRIYVRVRSRMLGSDDCMLCSLFPSTDKPKPCVNCSFDVLINNSEQDVAVLAAVCLNPFYPDVT